MSDIETDSDGQPRSYCRELRRDSRQRVLLSGKLIDDHSGIAADCVIRDRSPHGARIKVTTEGLSTDPVLIAVTEGLAYESRVVWRTNFEAGLQFRRSVDISRDAPAHLSRAHHIWVELARR